MPVVARSAPWVRAEIRTASSAIIALLAEKLSREQRRLCRESCWAAASRSFAAHPSRSPVHPGVTCCEANLSDPDLGRRVQKRVQNLDAPVNAVLLEIFGKQVAGAGTLRRSQNKSIPI